MQLNPAQQAAVEHRGSPLLVLAGAGTGKTRVITHRVAALMDEGTPPWRILAVTFTNKAAAEMRARIAKMCEGRHDVSQLWVGTFHSISARILRRLGEPVGLSRNFAIYDTDDQTRLMKRVFKELNRDDEQIKPRAILGHLDQLKNRGLTIDQVHELGLESFMTRLVSQLGRRYQDLLRAADAADFGDLLVLAVKLLEGAGAKPPREGAQLVDIDPVVGLKRRFQHVVVDEYQDTNPVQARLVELLSGRAELCVVGDDDQAIYGWRGADVSQILGFPDRRPGCELIRLEQNYRSTGHILHCADAVIRRNEGRLGKTLWSDLGDGELVTVRTCEDEREEARYVVEEILDALNEDVPPEEIAVFYRTHAQSRVIEQQLTDRGMRYAIFGGLGFYERKEIKDILAYLRLLQNPASDLDFTRIVNEPARGIGDTTVGRLTTLAASRGVPLLTVARTPEEAGVGGAAVKKLGLFVAMIDELAALLHEKKIPLGELASEVLERTGYRDALAQEDSEEAEARIENLDEFVGALTDFAAENPDQTLADYLEQVSLVADADGDGKGDVRAVRLMTIHSAKGLEFEKVILTGMEEKVFPHSRVIAGEEAAREEHRRMTAAERAQIEEERRLAYVAVTRAKRQLVVTWAKRRRLYNQEFVGAPSRFLRDLPQDSVRGRVPGAPIRREGQGVGPAAAAPVRVVAPPPARESQWNSDIVYDEAPTAGVRRGPAASSDDGPALFVGMPVRHKQYGEGQLMGWDGSGSNLKLHLRFAGIGTKTILARFCEPL